MAFPRGKVGLTGEFLKKLLSVKTVFNYKWQQKHQINIQTCHIQQKLLPQSY